MIVDIYLITNVINGKEYVGITNRGYLKRFREHINTSKSESSKRKKVILHMAMKKYGTENFKVELIEQVDSYDFAKVREKEYISKFNTYIKAPLSWGYNMTAGGDNIWIPQFSNKRRLEMSKIGKALHQDPEYREKFLERMRSEDVRKKIGNANRGEKNGMYGRGYLVSGERNYNYGKTGELSIQYGKTRSQDTKDSIRENTIKNWNENKEFRENNLKHLKELGEKQRGANNPTAKITYLYDLEFNLIGEHVMKELYDILQTYPAKVREYRDSNKEFKGYYIFSSKLKENKDKYGI